MKDQLIQNSIRKSELQLSVSQKLIHYRVSIFALIVSIACFSDFFQRLDFDFDRVFMKFGIVFLFLSLVSFFKQKSELKLRRLKIKTFESGSFENILQITKTNNWIVETATKKIIVISVKRPYSSGRYFITQTMGEKIYIFFNHSEVYYKSIYDLSSFGFVVSSGENKENEEKLTKAFS